MPRFGRDMSADEYVKAVAGGCHIAISATPGAASTEIEGVDQWRGELKIRIGARPEKNAANEELVRFLSDALSVNGRDIEIIKGRRSHRKVVFVSLTPQEAIERLGMD